MCGSKRGAWRCAMRGSGRGAGREAGKTPLLFVEITVCGWGAPA